MLNMTDTDQIEAQDIKRLLIRVYRRYSAGQITEAQARQETYLLNSALKAVETSDIEERLSNLESLME